MTRPIDGVDVVLADLDGVVYAGPNPIAHAIESLNEVARSIRVGYVTNNASRTDESVAQHLRDLGLNVETRDVVTSPQAAMSLLRDVAAPGSTILVIGGEGLTSEVSKAGFVVTDSAEHSPAAVIQGFSPDLGWKHLAEAAFALNKREPGASEGIPWIATNMDWTIPVARGVAPGNGTLVSAVHLAVGRMPIVAGKPELPIFNEAKRRFETDNMLFIGDRLDTDIKGAVAAGMKSVLVLTGIDNAKMALAAPRGSRPTYIVDDLRQLHEPYPETVTHADGSVSVGNAHVVKRGMELVVEREGAHPLDAVRAACTLIWDSGLQIYGFDVPARLHGYRP